MFDVQIVNYVPNYQTTNKNYFALNIRSSTIFPHTYFKLITIYFSYVNCFRGFLNDIL